MANISVLHVFMKMHLPFPVVASGKALFSKVTRYLPMVQGVLETWQTYALSNC